MATCPWFPTEIPEWERLFPSIPGPSRDCLMTEGAGFATACAGVIHNNAPQGPGLFIVWLLCTMSRPAPPFPTPHPAAWRCLACEGKHA
ncbi:hypothetical protein SKAU_G00242120 [Synaphobranchus kaupii]|uniref:Uncharacterized protein n=1 Tax=Synaphobranchus kaupii TaxID=118154 RepID=A0A9Q1IUF9_SYNKA|nr:hypothetical protein SKAU_G00242120 [Synaphobranchus kaupii]